MAPTDTTAEADAVQFDRLRKASPARRAEIARSLSATVIILSRKALRERMPGCSELEISLA